VHQCIKHSQGEGDNSDNKIVEEHKVCRTKESTPEKRTGGLYNVVLMMVLLGAGQIKLEL
jgi:hypothetical protein